MPSLTLKPSQAAVDRKLAGFMQGKPLVLNFKSGELLATVLERFNTYRGPENQIKRLVTSANQDYPLNSPLVGDLVLVVP